MCCIALIIPKHHQIKQIPLESVSQLLLMLHLRPDIQHEICVDFDYVMRTISPTFKNIIHQALVGFIVYLSSTKLLAAPQWLYAIPLAHLLAGNAKFQDFSFDPKKISFNDEIFQLGLIRSRTYDNESCRYANVYSINGHFTYVVYI